MWVARSRDQPDHESGADQSFPLSIIERGVGGLSGFLRNSLEELGGFSAQPDLRDWPEIERKRPPPGKADGWGPHAKASRRRGAGGKLVLAPLACFNQRDLISWRPSDAFQPWPQTMRELDQLARRPEPSTFSTTAWPSLLSGCEVGAGSITTGSVLGAATGWVMLTATA